MIIQIAAGILLAVFILGLIQELPDAFWYWFWGALAVFVVYWFWAPPVWAEILNNVLAAIFFGGLFLLVLAPFIYLDYRDKKRRKNTQK
ncbi:MAG: hypothetical protein J6W40_03270 [Alphaproteobacteria bacterium]|nr:hypothetical protein [Alphaproteobacteria bacterium]